MAGRKIVGIRLSEARDLYEEWYRKRGMAQNTIETIHWTLTGLEQTIGNKVVRNIDVVDIDKFFADRADRGRQQSTLNLYTTRLNNFFVWCVRKSFIDPNADPMDGRTSVDAVPKERIRMPQEDFPRLLDSAPNPRDRIVLALGLYTFMRSSEVKSLRKADLFLDDTEPHVAFIRWKQRARAAVPVSLELKQELIAYLAWYSQHVGRQLEPHFLVAPGNVHRRAKRNPDTGLLARPETAELSLLPTKPMYEGGYARVVHAALRDIGYDVPAGEGMHTLRRSGARALFDELRERKNFDDAMLTVMALLGHRRPDTTLIYLGVKREEERAKRVLAGQVMFPVAEKVRQAGLGDNVVHLAR